MKWNWGWGMVGLYGSFVVLIMALVFISSQQEVDLVAPDYYEKEIRYEETIQKTRRASSDPVIWTASGRMITLTFSKPVSSGSIHVYRPSDSRLDFYVPITTGHAATQVISLRDKPAGLWKFMAEWKIDGQSFYAEKRFYVE